MEFKEALKQLPKQPGIYFMMDSFGTIIYVGKAKDLKARVSQYFHKNKNNSPKINEMVGNINSFKYIITDTELDAFLLESRTIRELKPKYNRLLKNYKSYKYIKLSINESFPKISMTIQKKMDGALYFGPFTSEGSVRNTIEFIKDFYPIRKCSNAALRKNSTGCLNYNFGKCLAPCRGNDVQEDYRNHINNIVKLLEGKDYAPIKSLHTKMNLSASNLDFEKAAEFRDQIRGIRHVLNKQRVIKVSGYGRNILAAEKLGESEFKLFFIKGNKLLHSEVINTSYLNKSELENRLESLIAECFKPVKNEDSLSQEDIDEAQIIYSYLKRNNKIKNIKIPSSRIDAIDFNKMVISEFIDTLY